MGQLDITYRRNAGQSFMILPQEEEVTPYEEEMLKNNEIPVLLPFFSFREEGERQFWYDITGKKSVRHLFGQEGVKRETLCQILLALLEAYRTLDEYLIADSHICLNEDTLFLSGQGAKDGVYLCYLPAEREGLEGQLRSFYEYLMPLVESEDEALVNLVYGGYGALCDGSFTMEAMENDIRESLLQKTEEQLWNGRDLAPSKEDPFFEEKEMPPFCPDSEPWEGFGEEEEEEEKPSLLRRIRSGFSKLGSGLFGRARGKKEEYFPPKDLEEDLIYDPGESLPEPTVLLAEDAKSCFGRLVYEGRGGEKDFVLDQDEYRIGSRDPSNDILLHSSAVSRHHARLWRKGEMFYLEDLNSTNGTFVNGETVNINEPVELHYMDKVSFADVEYRMV